MTKAAAFADAKPSSFDENVFEVARAPQSSCPRHVDFDRVKQKFEKPTSLRLNVKSMHTKPVVKLGQPNGPGGGSGVGMAASSSKRQSAEVSLGSVGEGALALGQVVEGENGSSGAGFAMTTSMNLDELKVSDDDVSS